MLRPEATAPASLEAQPITPAVPPSEKPGSRIQQFPVARFWAETITIEEEITPDVELASDPLFDVDERTLLVTSSEDVLADLDVSEGNVVGVSWNGRKIGELDIGRSRGTKLFIRNVRAHRGLGAGAYLKISEDFTSFQRRSRAVSRILEGRSQIWKFSCRILRPARQDVS